MPGFDKDEFWIKILSYYPEARENNYRMKLGEEEVNELKSIFLNIYVPMEKLRIYDDQRIMKEMMQTIVSIYKLDKDAMTNRGEVVELVNSVSYDGKNLYLRFGKISPIKLRRFELGKTKKQIADKMGYPVSTIENVEDFLCDFHRQPDSLVIKLAKALEWEPNQIREVF